MKGLLHWLHLGPKRRGRLGAKQSLDQFQKQIGYRFRDRELLESALKHRSIIFETGEPRGKANERLEFLGDAVLDLLVAEQLYAAHPDAREGELTRLKSFAVSGRQLALCARRIGLGAYMQISEGEERSGGRTRRSILEDALEAVIGAIYLDGGLLAARRFVLRFVSEEFTRDEFVEQERNFKSVLLEYAQGQGLGHPHYEVVSEEGPDHAKLFHVRVEVDGEPVGLGEGRSKKDAEQAAARQAAEGFGLLGPGNGELEPTGHA